MTKVLNFAHERRARVVAAQLAAIKSEEDFLRQCLECTPDQREQLMVAFRQILAAHRRQQFALVQ